MSSLQSAHALHHARELRKRAADLRYEAKALVAGACALEREVWGPNPLRGTEIVDHALAVLADFQVVHYTRLAEMIEENAEGRKIAGQSAADTLTAALHRDPRVVRRGEGFWALNDDFGNDSASVAEHDTGK